MGKLKQWAMDRPCEVCGKEDIDSVDPVALCSEDCKAEYDSVMHSIADQQMQFEFGAGDGSRTHDLLGSDRDSSRSGH